MTLDKNDPNYWKVPDITEINERYDREVAEREANARRFDENIRKRREEEERKWNRTYGVFFKLLNFMMLLTFWRALFRMGRRN